jgi:hypothetical protein
MENLVQVILKLILERLYPLGGDLIRDFVEPWDFGAERDDFCAIAANDRSRSALLASRRRPPRFRQRGIAGGRGARSDMSHLPLVRGAAGQNRAAGRRDGEGLAVVPLGALESGADDGIAD